MASLTLYSVDIALPYPNRLVHYQKPFDDQHRQGLAENLHLPASTEYRPTTNNTTSDTAAAGLVRQAGFQSLDKLVAKLKDFVKSDRYEAGKRSVTSGRLHSNTQQRRG